MIMMSLSPRQKLVSTWVNQRGFVIVSSNQRPQVCTFRSSRSDQPPTKKPPTKKSAVAKALFEYVPRAGYRKRLPTNRCYMMPTVQVADQIFQRDYPAEPAAVKKRVRAKFDPLLRDCFQHPLPTPKAHLGGENESRERVPA